jgi:hypothetical protein
VVQEEWYRDVPITEPRMPCTVYGPKDGEVVQGCTVYGPKDGEVVQGCTVYGPKDGMNANMANFAPNLP